MFVDASASSFKELKAPKAVLLDARKRDYDESMSLATLDQADAPEEEEEERADAAPAAESIDCGVETHRLEDVCV